MSWWLPPFTQLQSPIANESTPAILLSVPSPSPPPPESVVIFDEFVNAVAFEDDVENRKEVEPSSNEIDFEALHDALSEDMHLLEEKAFENPRPAPPPPSFIYTGVSDAELTLPPIGPSTPQTNSLPPISLLIEDLLTAGMKSNYLSSRSSNTTIRGDNAPPPPETALPEVASEKKEEEEVRGRQLYRGKPLVPPDYRRGISPKTMVQPDGTEYKSIKVFVSRRGISRHLVRSKFSISRERTPTPAFIKVKPEDEGPPTFRNPWDGSTIKSGITSDGHVVYSTEVYWGTHVQRGEPQKLTNIERKYFGSDDDEIHLPPKFQRRFIYNYY